MCEDKYSRFSTQQWTDIFDFARPPGLGVWLSKPLSILSSTRKKKTKWPALVENTASVLPHNIVRWMGWHLEGTWTIREGKDDHTGDCWMDQKAGGFLKSGKDCVLQNGEEAGTRRRDMRGIESTAGVVKLATTHRKATSVSFPVVASGRKNISLTVTKPTHRCATFVVKNGKTKTTCFGGARNGKLFFVKKKTPSSQYRPACPPCTSWCGVFLQDPEAVAWADAQTSAQPLFVICNTLPANTLADAKFKSETPENDSVAAWTDGASVC